MSRPATTIERLDFGRDAAREAVAQAERRAGIQVVQGVDLEQILEAASTWERVWSRDNEPPVPAEVLRALVHAGNYLSLAYNGDQVVGALLGFYAGDDSPTHVHSHIAGVDPAMRGRGVGFALKLHQRLWTLEHGFDTVRWTYDPLVRANGYFNIAKLATKGVEYHVNFYGAMPDAINQADESDRILVNWDLLADDVEAAAMGTPREATVEACQQRGATIALETGAGGEPVVRDVEGGLLLCHTPDDIVALRRERPELARAWRLAVRDVLAAAIGRGLQVSGMTRTGWYVLSPPGVAS